MTRLSIAERGCWDGILLLAQESPVRGKLMLTENQPMTVSDISRALSLTNREKTYLKSCISKMIDLDSLRWNGEALEVIHFTERQEKYPSDFQDYHKKPPEKLLQDSDTTPERLRKEEEGKRGEEDTYKPTVYKADAKKSNTLKTGKQVSPDPRINQILDTIGQKVGYEIANFAKEGAAVKRALKMGFSPEQFIACWEKLKTFAFWKGKWLPLAVVTENLGEFVAGRLEDVGRKEASSPATRKISSEQEIARSLQ